MSSQTRRQFLSTLAAAGAAVPLIGAGEQPGAGPPARAVRPAAPTINVFSKHLQFLDYEAMAETAAEIGFDGVDLTVRGRKGAHVLPENVEEDLPRAVEAIRGAGLEVPMMATDITDPKAAQTKTVLETASDLGIRHYRMGKFSYPEETSVEEALQAYKAPMRQLAKLNEQFGIHGDYQNHAGTRVGGPVWDLWMLLDGLDPAWIGCQYDIRHATVEGARSWPVGLDLMASYVGTLTIKDFRWTQEDGGWVVENVPLGEGMVDFASFFEQLKAHQISVPMSMHFEYDMVEAEEAVSQVEHRQGVMRSMRRDLQHLRTLLKNAGL